MISSANRKTGVVVVFFACMVLSTPIVAQQIQIAPYCASEISVCQKGPRIAQDCSACTAKVRECMVSMCKCTASDVNRKKECRDCQVVCTLQALGGSAVCDNCTGASGGPLRK